MYKADNWTFCGKTKGSTKTHKGMINPFERLKTSKKLIYCRWIKNKIIIPTKEHIGCWRQETIQEKLRVKEIANKKNNLLTLKYYL